MPVLFLPHTADIRMQVTGKTLEELFCGAVAGMMELLDGKSAAEDFVVEAVAVQAQDRTVLLIDFLNEILTRALTEKRVYRVVRFSELSETRAACEVEGRSVASFQEDIKAVTYHEASVEKKGGIWETVVIFDV